MRIVAKCFRADRESRDVVMPSVKFEHASISETRNLDNFLDGLLDISLCRNCNDKRCNDRDNKMSIIAVIFNRS